ncbi:MAG: lipopolysaccharide biosynthesis protein RfbH [Victivallales bacterium]|nr:lipopolysaccharide biosynthesis protein RfbH [Victivallales bacterium]
MYSDLKKEILDKVSEYFSLVNDTSGKDFTPGDRIPYAGRVFDEKELVNLVDSSLEFWLTNGRYTQEFEETLARFLGIKHCLMVNSGSSANLLAFMALTSPLLGERSIRRGDEVITVACAFPTTVAPIIQYGAVPVFVDIELETANIDCTQLETAFTGKTKAVMLAHTLGNPFDVKKITDFCESRNLWLIEDNCDSLGSTLDGQLTGTFGDIGTSSFYPPHHITTGEGGATYTNNPSLHKIMLSMRDWGRDCWCASGHDNSCGKRFKGQHGSLPQGYDHKYVYSHFGYNLKATDLQAAIGCAQLEKLQNFIATRRRNFAFLHNAIKDIPFIRTQSPLQNTDPAWFGFLITLDENAPVSRNQLAEHLEKSNIQTRNLFAGNITRHPCFEHLVLGTDYRIAAPLINTDIIMNQSLWVGVYPGLDINRLNHIAATIHESCVLAGRPAPAITRRQTTGDRGQQSA